MKFLVFVTPPSIYHGCSTRKSFWEENFTGKQAFLKSVSMKSVGVAKLRNTRRSRVVTNVSPWIFMIFEYLREVWQSEQDGNHIFRVKSKIGEIREGVGNRYEYQDQSKVGKIQKGKVCHQKCQNEGPLQQNQRVWKLSRYLMWKGSPNMTPLQVIFI